MFVCCLFDRCAALRAFLKSTLPLGVGQKLLGLDAPTGVRKNCEKTSSRITSTKGAGERLV
jgi:hypothetical protein